MHPTKAVDRARPAKCRKPICVRDVMPEDLLLARRTDQLREPLEREAVSQQMLRGRRYRARTPHVASRASVSGKKNEQKAITLCGIFHARNARSFLIEPRTKCKCSEGYAISSSYAVAKANHSTSGAAVLHPFTSQGTSFEDVTTFLGTAGKPTVRPFNFSSSARG